MELNPAGTALSAAKQISNLSKARKKQAKQRQFSILSALRTQPLPAEERSRILASAPGHQRLIVEKILNENALAAAPASGPSGKNDHKNNATKGTTVSNTTQSIDSTQGLDQAVQDAESTLDTLKDGKAEKLSKKAEKATKKADKVGSKADRRRAKADKAQAKALKRQHKVAKKAANKDESAAELVQRRVAAVTSAAESRAGDLAEAVRTAPDSNLADTVTRWGRTAATTSGDLLSQAQERGSAFLESDAVGDALDSARDQADKLGRQGAALASTGTEAAKKKAKKFEKDHAKEIKAARKKARKTSDSARKSLESAWSQASDVVSETSEAAVKEGGKAKKKAGKQAKKAKKLAQKNANTASKQLSASQRKISKKASKNAEKVRAKELKKAAKADNKKKHTGRNILLLAIIAAAVAFVAQKAKSTGAAPAPAKTPRANGTPATGAADKVE
ncbi:MAG: hypothetical protein ACTHVC_12205, partial [Candidatus Corynebacterium faecigallinarum]